MSIEISCDLGEAGDAESLATEQAIWPLIDAANVACGGHAGSADSMRDAAVTAARRGIILGAHPSYPDRENFGRKTMRIDLADLRASLISQISLLRDVASRAGATLSRVKAHGALYNDAHKQAELAAVIVDAMEIVGRRGLEMVASESSEMAKAARARGLGVVREAFADRRYRDDGSLVSRTEPDALLSVAEAAAQAESLARDGTVVTQSGGRISIAFDTICIHADMAQSVERLMAIRTRLRR